MPTSSCCVKTLGVRDCFATLAMTVYYAYGTEKRFLLCAGTAEPDEFSPAEPVDYDGFSL